MRKYIFLLCAILITAIIGVIFLVGCHSTSSGGSYQESFDCDWPDIAYGSDCSARAYNNECVSYTWDYWGCGGQSCYTCYRNLKQ